MRDVKDLLALLANGETTLGEVAIDFATRKWPEPVPPAVSYDDLAARELNDPEPIKPNSWAEVEAAYTSGQLDDRQYRALFAAKTSGKT